LDLTLQDDLADRVGSTSRGERRFDLPGGAKRMIMPSRSAEYTVVNGVVTWADTKLNGAAAFQVLRS
jgi:N-acyl-D-amino-acid deacylase